MAVDRLRLARYVARSLQDLAKGAGWSTATRADGEDTLSEGDYTDSIDTALRRLGFVQVDPVTGLATGVVDATLAQETDFERLADVAIDDALDRLQRFYAMAVDTIGGPVRIYRSQIAQALAARGRSGGRAVRSVPLGTRVVEDLLS